jgi:serine O-acetyltransferase
MDKKQESKVVKMYRKANWLYQRKMYIPAKIYTKLIRLLFSAEIPASCTLGEGVQLKHGGLGVVLHDNLVIGANSVIYQHVTIGGREKSGTPKVGRNVYIGAGACILGDVTIGDNVKIGANSVVLQNVAEGQTVVGIPARVVEKVKD